MEVQGELIVINETETIGAKGFQKRLAVVKTNDQYPQTIPVECTEWKGRYFANIQGWNINKGEREKSADSFMPDRQAEMPQIVDLEDDGLPF